MKSIKNYPTKIVKSVTKEMNQFGMIYLKIIYEDFTYQVIKNVDELNQVFNLSKYEMKTVSNLNDTSQWIGIDFTEISNKYNTKKLAKHEIQDIVFNQLIF